MANASALFQIDPGTGSYGTAGVAQNAAAGATINCRLASTIGVDSVQWRIFGTSENVTAPSLTTSGSPPGQIVTFTLPATLGASFGIECKVNGGTGVTLGNSTYGDTKTSAVYVLNADGIRPFFIGETFESDAIYGVVPRVNVMRALAGVAAGATKVRAVSTANVANLAAFNVSTNTDGVTLIAGDIVLLSAQTTAAQNGPYVVGTVAAGVAPLTRPTWFATGASIQSGFKLEVGGEGTVFKNTTWKAFVASSNFTVGTTDGKFYPLSVSGSVALVAGTTTISTVPIFSTKTNVNVRRTAPVSTTNTHEYVLNGNPTPGAIGTGSVTIWAAQANGTLQNSDASTVNWTIINQG
jgi:hypothetical protein